MKASFSLLPTPYSLLFVQGLSLVLTILLGLKTTQPALSLPESEDIPEEVLRTEIVLEGRSPLDGRPVTLSEYLRLQEQLAQSKFPPNLNPEIRHQIFLLELLKFLRTFSPLSSL